jgi:hypothetical protein
MEAVRLSETSVPRQTVHGATTQKIIDVDVETLEQNKPGKVWAHSLEYIDVRSVFFTHHVGHCCTNVFGGYCCTLGYSCTDVFQQWEPRIALLCNNDAGRAGCLPP